MLPSEMISSDRSSIFGDTYDGVPNPNIPHVHPYPTVSHGPNWTIPNVAQASYRTNPTIVPMDGFGADCPEQPAPLFAHVTGSGIGDAVLGAGMGAIAAYTVSKSKDDLILWPAVTALAMYLAGTAGLLGAGAAFLWTQSKRKG